MQQSARGPAWVTFARKPCAKHKQKYEQIQRNLEIQKGVESVSRSHVSVVQNQIKKWI